MTDWIYRAVGDCVTVSWNGSNDMKNIFFMSLKVTQKADFKLLINYRQSWYLTYLVKQQINVVTFQR